jgi:hypothetical protein
VRLLVDVIISRPLRGGFFVAPTQKGVLVPPAKQYEVLRFFVRTDRRTGAETPYKVGDVYAGPLDKDYLTSPEGPDGKGPLIAEKTVAPATPAPATPASDSPKEK